MGDPYACADRHDGGSRRFHRPVRIPQPLYGEPEHRQALLDVYVRVAKGVENDLLPSLTSGDAYRPGVGRPNVDRRAKENVFGAGSPCLLARKSRSLRGLSITYVYECSQ